MCIVTSNRCVFIVMVTRPWTTLAANMTPTSTFRYIYVIVSVIFDFFWTFSERCFFLNLQIYMNMQTLCLEPRPVVPHSIFYRNNFFFFKPNTNNNDNNELISLF